MNEIEGSRILITGGAGFVGSFIADELLSHDVKEIILLDNLVRGTRENIETQLKTGKVRLVEGDVRDRALVKGLLKGINYCYHMAALRINHCVAEPRQAIEVMIDGTYNVLEACVENKIKKIVAASSASIYGTAESFPTREDHHPYNNHTLYGAAKTCNEGMLRAFQDIYGLSYNAMRYFNIYGPRMDIHGKYTEVLIRWYKLIRAGKQPVIYGDGKQTMDFIYVEDVAKANVLSLKSGVSDEVFNVASGIETSLEGLCWALIETMSAKVEPNYIPLPDQRKKVEVSRRLADVSKARRVLGFEAEISLKQGLQKLVAWLSGKFI